MLIQGREKAYKADRLDKFLTEKLKDFKRTFIQRQIKEGKVSVNGVIVNKTGYKLEEGDVVEYSFDIDEMENNIVPEDIPIDIIYEDEYFLAVNKPAGMVVHPASGHKTGTLLNAIYYKYPDIMGIGGNRPGLVHRLDKETSGVIVIAKDLKTFHKLQELWKNKKVKKYYLAFVYGDFPEGKILLEGAIGRHPKKRHLMAVVENGKEAVTEVVKKWSNSRVSLVVASPITGRTHQIRVHLSNFGYPIISDDLYGFKSDLIDRVALHSYKLFLPHPVTEEIIEITAPLPKDFENLIKVLGVPENACTI